MALISNKTAIESILGNFEKKHVDAIYNAAAQTIISHSDFRNKHFAYSLNSYQKKIASSVGIELYPNGYMPHSHPLSKIFENHLLFDVLPNVVNTNELTMCSIKESKVLVFKQVAKNKSPGAVTFINRLVASKDASRYTEEADSFFMKCASPEAELFSNNFIKCIQSKKAVFFHDEVHHWSKRQMFSFLKRTKVKRFIFTIVYPPELLVKYANSQNPKVYDFKVDKGRLFFFPDGVQTEAYEQQLNLHWLFSASHLQSGDNVWTVTRHKSIYAHHLFEITVGDLKTDSKIFFSDYQTIDLSKLFLDRWKSYEVFPISIQHLYKVYSYLLCLKKPDLESGLAKLRQIIGDDVEIKEFLFFEQFCKRIIQRQTSWGLFGHSFFERLTEITLNALPNSVARLFPAWKNKNTFEFLFSLGTFKVEMERRRVYEHVLEEWGFEVVLTDENAFLDPMNFFGLNENFNEDRVDDGYLERVKLPFWNSRDYNPKRSRTNAYDILGQQLRRQRELDEGLPHGPNKMLQIEFYGIKEFEVDPFISNGINEFTLCELLIGKRISQLKYGLEKQSNVVSEYLQWACMEGIDGLNSELFLERRLIQSGHEHIESTEEEGKNETGENNDRKCSPFLIDICDISNDGDASETTYESEKENEEKERALLKEKPLKHVEKEEKKEKEKFEINYRNIYKPYDCNAIHGQDLPTPPDGNCFLHAFKTAFECEGVHELRENFADFLLTFEGGVFSDQSPKVRQNGIYFEAEWILLFCMHRGVSLVVHDRCAEPEKVYIINDGYEIGHIVQTGEHFTGIETFAIGDLSATTLSECVSGYDPRLLNYQLSSNDFKCFQWRGRKSAFLTRVDADYGHNGMMYPINKWCPSMDEIIKICDPNGDYNCALINFYDANSSLGLHKDNESVYNDDPILTVNMKGEGLFVIELKSEKNEFIMTPGSFFIMPRGFQKKARHAVSNESPRISITFRRHVRRMNGSRIELVEALGKNLCLIRAFSEGMGRSIKEIISKLKNTNHPFWTRFISDGAGGTVEDCEIAAAALGVSVNLLHDGKCVVLGDGGLRLNMELKDNHFKILKSYIPMERTFVSHLQKRSQSATSGLAAYLEKDGKLGVNHMSFIAQNKYARTLANSFMNLTTGICSSRALDKGEVIFKEIIENEVDEFGLDVIAICGFAGSGKSRQLQHWLHARKCSSFCVVCPRTNLNNDWQFKLELEPNQSRKVITFEKFLKQDKSKLDLIVLDELTLFPNGYLDLLAFSLMKCNSACQVVLLFDPLQARYHNKTDEGILNFEHEVDRLITGAQIQYIYSSFRMGKFFERFFDTPCLSPESDSLGETFWILDDVFSIKSLTLDRGNMCDVLLVESDLEKKAFGSHILTMTFGESQGLTFNHACILLSESTANSNEFRWLVALTRSRTRMSFCCTFLGGLDEFKSRRGGGAINKILNSERIDKSYFNSLVKCELIFQKKEVGGADEINREERLEGDPFLKPYIFLGQRINCQNVEIEEPTPEDPKCSTHLYISEPNFGLCYNFDFIREKEQREYREDMLVTNQFCDSYEKVHIRGKRETVGPMRFKAIYPKHSADDDMTFWMAVKKRLKFREEEENYQRLQRAHLIGGLLYQNFKKKLKLSFNFDQGLLEESINNFEKKKLEKSCGTIKSHSIRSDIDWALNDVFLFMKSQLCTKYEKQFVDAKAGQTLACFQHLILVQFAPWCRYLESQIRAQLPEEIYIHSNKNFDDLNAWVKKFFQRDICVESDYEAFDASQDEYILSFEIHLMKDAHFPQEVIDAYIDLKCKLGCKLGHFSIMRFTGEFCTFLFNTLANIAFTLCRYEWREGQPIAFAGDDMCALNNLPVSHNFDDLFEAISLKAKVERTETPMFCGWRLTPYGIVKEPELVYNRFQVAIEEGKIFECLENYAIEVSYAYSLSERLFEVLKSERQIQYHQAVVRFIVTHIDKLKTKVRDLFLEQSSDEEI